MTHDTPCLLRLAVQGMLATARAILLELEPPGIIPAVLFGGVITLFALRACQRDYRSYIFLRCHFYLHGRVQRRSFPNPESL